MAKKLTLDIITQEKRLLTVETSSVNVETAMGEITILPGHIPLITRLKEGLLRYHDEQGKEKIVAVFGGFLELDGSGVCSILADSAVRADDIDVAKVENAKKEAENALKDKTREQEFVLAEAALRRTALELRAANKKSRHSQTWPIWYHLNMHPEASTKRIREALTAITFTALLIALTAFFTIKAVEINSSPPLYENPGLAWLAPFLISTIAGIQFTHDMQNIFTSKS